MMYLIAAIGVVGVGVGVTTRDDLGGGLWWYLSAMVLLIVVGVIASRLTVSIGDDAVTAAFGWGWPRRRIELGHWSQT